MIIGNYTFHTKQQGYIMGILNVTPDSFSDGGHYVKMDDILYHVEEMIRDGATIIDVGGESTRPGHMQISDQEEVDRVTPVIEKIRADFDTVVSLDTYKPAVAKAGIEAGAHMINDIWGLRSPEDPDHEMAALIARSGVACCLMHNRQKEISGDQMAFLDGFCQDMEEIVRTAREAGIKEDQIILDPGIGFGETREQDLILMNHMEIMQQWKLPVLLGTSRKRVIGIGTGGLPTDQRDEGTAATTVLGRQKGASFFRVHHVKMNARALAMADAILNAGQAKTC